MASRAIGLRWAHIKLQFIKLADIARDLQQYFGWDVLYDKYFIIFLKPTGMDNFWLGVHPTHLDDPNLH